MIMIKNCLTLQGLDAERDVLRESQRLASERDRELESLRQQVRMFAVAQYRELFDLSVAKPKPK